MVVRAARGNTSRDTRADLPPSRGGRVAADRWGESAHRRGFGRSDYPLGLLLLPDPRAFPFLLSRADRASRRPSSDQGSVPGSRGTRRRKGYTPRHHSVTPLAMDVIRLDEGTAADGDSDERTIKSSCKLKGLV